MWEDDVGGTLLAPSSPCASAGRGRRFREEMDLAGRFMGQRVPRPPVDRYAPPWPRAIALVNFSPIHLSHFELVEISAL